MDERARLFSTSFFDKSQKQASKSGPPPVPDNYVSSKHDDSGHILIQFWIGPDNYFIPNSEWRQENADFCLEQNRFMKPALQRMTIRIVPNIGMVFIQIVDVETGVITKQREGEGDLDSNWLQEGIDEAWDQLVEEDGLDIKGAGDPCGDEAQLVLDFESTINHQIQTSDGHGTNVHSVVISEVPVSFSETDQIYLGDESLEYVSSEYSNSIEDIPEIISCSFDFNDGELNAEIDFPEAGFRYSPDIEVVLGNFIIDSMPHATYSCTDDEGNVSQGRDDIWWSTFVLMNSHRGISGTELLFSDWQESDDRFIIATITVEETETFPSEDGELTITEKTTLRIRHSN